MWNRIAGSFTGQRRENDLARELESHIRMQTEDNLRLGMPPEQARREAVLKFGAVESAKEDYRDQRGLPQLDLLLQDWRYGLRQLVERPDSQPSPCWLWPSESAPTPPCLAS